MAAIHREIQPSETLTRNIHAGLTWTDTLGQEVAQFDDSDDGYDEETTWLTQLPPTCRLIDLESFPRHRQGQGPAEYLDMPKRGQKKER